MKTHHSSYRSLALAVAALVACGGAESQTPVDATAVLDWAQYKYPTLFPKGPSNVSLTYLGTAYTVRSYPTGNALGITTGGDVYGLGPFNANVLTRYGSISDFSAQVLADACNVNPGSCASTSAPATVSVGYSHTLLRRADGRVLVLGSGMRGGDPVGITGTAAALVAGVGPVADVHAGLVGSSNFAVTSDGNVWGWGLDNTGILLGAQPSTEQVVDTARIVASLGAVKSISTCADVNPGPVLFGLDQDGGVRFTPATATRTSISGGQVTGMDSVVALSQAMRSEAICDAHAVKADGSVWRLSLNFRTVAGALTRVVTVSPLANLPAIRQVACSPDHCVALGTDGALWAWGANNAGQLGDGTQTGRTVPVRVGNVPSVARVVVARGSSFALTVGGGVFTWGALSISDGNAQQWSATPVRLYDDASGVVELSVAEGTGVMRLKDGTVWGWGNNLRGELGTGTTTSTTSDRPVQALGINLN